MRVEKAMTRDVVCIRPQDSIADAYEIMTEWEIRHLPVLDGGKLVGILSDRDALIYSKKIGNSNLAFGDERVSVAMTRNLINCTPNTDITTICELMLDHKIDSIPVVNEDELVGLVTSSDLIQLLLNQQEVATKLIPFKYQVYASTRPGQCKRTVGMFG